MCDENPITWQWLGGFFDGEGSCNIYIKRSGTASAKIRLTNKNLDILEEIQDFLHYGTIIRKTGRDCYDLCIACSEDMRHFINRIAPYTRIKYHALMLVNSCVSITGTRWTAEAIAKATQLYQELIALNGVD
jgi:hypothetical protein